MLHAGKLTFAVYRRHCHSKSRAYAMIMRFVQAATDWSSRAASAIRAPRNLTGRGPLRVAGGRQKCSKMTSRPFSSAPCLRRTR